jgi:hypothetical protein
MIDGEVDASNSTDVFDQIANKPEFVIQLVTRLLPTLLPNRRRGVSF